MRNYILAVVGLYLTLFISGCFEKDSAGKGESAGTVHAARYANFVSSRIVPDGTIEVSFNSPLTDAAGADKEIDNKILFFEPGIEGKTVWKDERTIAFFPDRELPQGAKYRAVLKMNELDSAYADVADYEFEVEVVAREVRSYIGNIKELKANRVFYEAAIEFNYRTNAEDIKNSSSLTINGKSFSYGVTQGANDRTFIVKTSEFDQSDEKKVIIFSISSQKMELTSDFSREYIYTKTREMSVVQVSRLTDNDRPSIEILFSSAIAEEQDPSGLITIEPQLNFELRKIGSKLTVTGDFEFGKDYLLTVNRNITNSNGFKMKSDMIKNIQFTDKLPALDFTDRGCFLSSGNNKKIRFRSLNIAEVRIRVKKVYQSNLGQFLQNGVLQGGKSTSYWDFNYDDYGYEFERVGIVVSTDTLKISAKRNETVINELDLSRLMPKKDMGLYIIEMTYDDKNTLYRTDSEYSMHDGRSPMLFGKVTKNIIASNLGMSMIRSADESAVYVFDIETTEPVSGAEVVLFDYQNQMISSSKSDYRGRAVFKKQAKEIFIVTADKGGDRSVLKLNGMTVNFSAFDIGGAEHEREKIRAYIYTERGVYRPGDEINVSMIFRNSGGSFPKDHPIKIKIVSPLNKIYAEEVIKKGDDGFYTYKFSTREEDPTGTWNFFATAGDQSFNKSISVETIVAEALEVRLKPEKEKLSINDDKIKIGLSSKYLFGNPASNLRAEIGYTIRGINKTYPKYKDYHFSNDTYSFSAQTGSLFKGNLDNTGYASIDYKVPELRSMPSAASIALSAEVLEEGGRPNKDWISIDFDTYDTYAGMKKISEYIKAGTEYNLNTILLSADGETVPGRKMKLRIYLNERFWWWDYSERSDRMSYRSDFETQLVFEQDIISGQKPSGIKYDFKQDGLYLVELTLEDMAGHSSAFFVYASYWGGSRDELNSAELSEIRSDKQVYAPGETAVIKFPVPDKARVLVSLDKGSVNLENYSFTADGGEGIVKIPVRSDMAPNIYCTVSVIQPNASAANDRPARIIGTVPVFVEDKATRTDIKVTLPGSLRPNEKFKCKVQAGKETQFTIAVVEEGLLSITDFSTPDAWKNFYQKLRLGVSFYDLYSLVIGAGKGPVSNKYSVGGSTADRSKMLNEIKANRFKPVSLFKGPLKTDSKGNAEVEFTMPEYVGAVRVMAVCANGNTYGSFEKQVPVKTEIIAVPSLPRVLAVGDEAEVPVTVFCMDANIKEAEVAVEVSGEISSGDAPKKVEFDGISNKTVYFKIKTGNRTGIGKVKVTATAGKYRHESSAELSVGAVSPREFKTKTLVCEKGKSVEFVLPDYMEGSLNASVTVSKIKLPDVSKRLNYLIGYPYGCLEQTTSTAFAQLSVKPLLKKHSSLYESIDKNVNAAVSRLRSFQNSDGTFNYWPGQSNNYSGWSDIYAGHFLTEAAKKGYFVPADMLSNWKRSAHSLAIKFRSPDLKKAISEKNTAFVFSEAYYHTREQIYRLLVLAMAGEPEIGAMNIMKETNLSYLDDTEKRMLAMSYKLSGVPETAAAINKLSGVLVKDYSELYNSFGTGERDKALILYALSDSGDETAAYALYSNIADLINSDGWYSTQTLGFMMLSAGMFMEKFPAYFSEKSNISGHIAGGESGDEKFKLEGYSFVRQLKVSSKGKVTVSIDASADAEKCFVSLNYDGIPLKPVKKRDGKGIKIERTFTGKTENGDISKMKQGEKVVMNIKIKKLTQAELKNMAVVQILPSGWEIENARLSDASAYSSSSSVRRSGWGDDYRINQMIKYTDVRDDRVMWFFDMDAGTNEITLNIEIRAVSAGKYYMPATLAESMYSREHYALEPGFAVEVKK